MQKSRLLIIASASLISLLAGVAGTLVFTAEALYMAVPGETATKMSDVVLELRKAEARLGRVERVLDAELSAVRSELRGQSDRQPVDRRASARASASGPAGLPTSAAAGPGSHFTREADTSLQPANLGALRPLADWSSDPSVRSAWLFTTEESALESFGAPDEISVRGSSEWWTYWNVQGGAIASEYRLQFNAGRLVEGTLTEWEKPRRLPTAAR